MKTTGITRRIDSLGRVVLPMELRRTLDINENDLLEIFTEGDRIVLRKYEPTCVFCEHAENVINYKGKNICPSCLEELKKL